MRILYTCHGICFVVSEAEVRVEVRLDAQGFVGPLVSLQEEISSGYTTWITNIFRATAHDAPSAACVRSAL